MTLKAIHPVSSAEHMLEPTDIFVVAAHEDKAGQKALEKTAKKIGVTPERMLYSFMIKTYSGKNLIRIRAGNSLFTIAAAEGRIGFVQSYNGDTVQQYIENMHQFLESARKIGFDFLVAVTHTPEIVKILKLAVRKFKDPSVKTHFNSERGVFIVTTGERRN
jgi:hypothetical protein